MAILNITTLPQTAQNALGKFKATVEEHPLVAIGIGAGIVGVTAIAATATLGAIKKSSARKRTSTRRKTTKRRLTARQRYVRKIKRRPGRQTPYTAGARKDRSRTRVRYTKTGQPYRLTGKGGAARFIKKSAARSARRR